MTDHIKYFEKQIQNKLEQLPRAIKGDAPREVLDKILQELDILKDAKEAFSLHVVRRSEDVMFCCTMKQEEIPHTNIIKTTLEIESKQLGGGFTDDLMKVIQKHCA